ncbi:hypothetical protein M2427_008560, partial [Bradyrhizobium sp. BR13661]|nr:hypothetical protein [Bradyrhizobium sp. BR13661]MDH6264480.1 hypothetical protein [Bradyrhizobium sp. BR13661]MDH6264597.1 hypothetical protein [Bradyrhizobium sp. BR13661]
QTAFQQEHLPRSNQPLGPKKLQKSNRMEIP